MNDLSRPGRAQAADPAPYYEAHVFCCTNERPAGHPRGCCKAKGSEKLRDYTSGCLDRCELGPTMVIYPEGVWYHVETREDVDEVLQRHLIEGGRVERLMLKPEDKLPPSR